MKNVAVIVCGSRDYTGYSVIHQRLHQLITYADGGHVIILEGGARGADSLAAQVAREAGLTSERYEADWDSRGKAAGPIRNTIMRNRLLELRMEGYEAYVLAFVPQEMTKGTGHMVGLARKIGIPVDVRNAYGYPVL